MADELDHEKYEEYLHKNDHGKESGDRPEIFEGKDTDTDKDGLKDFEEEYFGTDINNPDTDYDGYSDYKEIQNGYNPLGEGKLNKESLLEIFQKISQEKEVVEEDAHADGH